MDRKKMSYSDRYNDRIEQLENEVKEKQQEIELSNNQSTIDILEEDIYNTKQSIEELKKYV
jgi:peptidoglycan hydrolase CwlO-like protein